jgi:Phytanoyl-CoA dioxygenase (PhyH)
MELVKQRGTVDLLRYWLAMKRYLRPGPAHLLMYLAARFRLTRRLGVMYYRAKSRPHSATDKHSVALQNVDLAQAIACLERDGFYEGLRLRDDTLNALRDFCQHSVCFGNGEKENAFFLPNKAQAEKDRGVTFSTGRYLDCSERCSAVRDLLNDRTLLSIARGYLGAEPTLLGARMWWSFAASSDSRQQLHDGQAFHYDLDDYRAIAFFFYLSDVDLESGPHVAVLGSHRRKPLRFLVSPFKSKSDDQISAAYGTGPIVAACGPAGTGFAEDLFCFHRGSHPKTRDRLLVQIRYRYRMYGDYKE